MLTKIRSNSKKSKWTAKTIVGTITKKLAFVFRVSPEYTQRFHVGLGTVYVDIVICQGEADTHIARSITENPKASVAGVECTRVFVSSDSDLLDYRSVPILLCKLSGSAGSGIRLMRND